MKKRILVALFAGATVFGAAFAFAAALNLAPGNLQAGNTAVAACQGTTNLTTTYAVTHAGGSYKVDQVTVAAINPACVAAGRMIGVTLTDGAGATLFTAAPTLVTSPTVVVDTSAGAVPAASVAQIHAVIFDS